MARKTKLPAGMWQRGQVYYARFSSQGRLVRKRLSTDFATAKLLLNDLMARSDRGDFGYLDNDYPWKELRAAFTVWADQEIRNPEDYACDLAKFEEFVTPTNIREITPDRIYGFRRWRLDQGAAASTVNKQVATINNMLNRGVQWNRIGHNPIASVKPLPKGDPVKQRRSLTIEEVDALFEHSPEHLKPVWRLFMVTGIRREELVDLRFDDIDWDRQTMTVRASVAKSKKSREIPLDDTTMAMLVELKEQAADREPVKGNAGVYADRQRANFTRDHVFVTRANTPLRNHLLDRFYSVCQRAGIDDGRPRGSVDIHSLRVSFTTISLEHGAKPKAVQEILGHSTLSMTMGVYAKATDRSKRDAISALPFAKASGPDHVLSVAEHSECKKAQESAQVISTDPNPLRAKTFVG